jgi:hypothetical protein
MPVILRHNDATELCMTKGQEGVVVGWNSRPGCFDTMALETVYVRLIKPPQTIRIPGLPKNTVPVTRAKHKVKCHPPDDTVLSIEREQVNILPNFSMTDYASQGKTRVYNVVDLSRCRTIQSIYTCISRSSNAANTVIAHPFNTKKICTPISGYLCQEFRETMILDEITSLKYTNALPASVHGEMRYPLVRSFQSAKLSLSASMSKWHSALKYCSADSLLDSNAAEFIWTGKLELPVKKGNTKASSNAKTKKAIQLHQPLVINAAPAPALDLRTQPVHKRARESQTGGPPSVHEPIGLIWNSVNYSCAYDSWFTVLRSVWMSNQVYWTNSFAAQGSTLAALAQGFSHHYIGQCTLENARDRVRVLLHGMNPAMFPMGLSYISLFDLVSYCIKVKVVGKTRLVCSHCPCSVDDGTFSLNSLTVINRHESQQRSHSQGSPTISQIIYALPASTHNPCYRCADIRLLNKSMRLESELDLLVFELWNSAVIPDLTLALDAQFGTRKLYTLRGLVYHGSNHFTS